MPTPEDVVFQINNAQTKEQLFETVNQFANWMGMDGVYIISYNPAVGMTSLDKRPEEWMNHYGREGYIHFDPIAYRAFQGGSSFTWDECIAQSNLSKSQKVLMQQARDFGLKQGYNSALTTPDYSAATCCFYNRDSGDFWDSLKGNVQALDIVGAVAQEKLRALMEEKVNIPQLSPRQIECLTWAARGKTNDEIGDILSISSNTVNSHIQAAAKVLKVSTKIHAVVKAVQLKVIFPF